VGGFLAKHLNVVARCLLVLGAVGLGMLVSRLGGASLSPAVIGGYLVAIGVMAGGTIAIVFAISVFLLQNASDLYSSPFLDSYIHDWRERFIYSTVILVTLGCLGSGVLVGGMQSLTSAAATAIVVSSLGLVGVVFALIDWQYQNVRQKINPVRAIRFLQARALDSIERFRADAVRTAGVLTANDADLSEELALATVYNRFLEPQVDDLDGQLEKLIEVALRLGENQEIGACKVGLAATFRVVDKYIETRSTSSLVVPSTVALLAVESDSQNLLARSFERLNKVGERFIRTGEDELVLHVMTGYAGLGLKAARMSFVGGRRENPIFGQISAYFGFLVDTGIRVKSMETVFQGSRIVGRLGSVSARHGLTTSLHVLRDKLMEAFAFGLTEKHSIVVDQCTGQIHQTIEAVFRGQGLVRRHEFGSLLDNLAQISGTVVAYTKAGLIPDDFAWRSSATKGYDEFPSLLGAILRRYQELSDPDDKARFRGDLAEFFKELGSSLRKLAETAKSADTLLAGSVARLVFEAGHLMLALTQDDEFSDIRASLRKQLSWYAHLPAWFAYHATKFDGGSHAFHELTDSVAKIGILAWERLEDEDLARACAESLHSMADHCLTKSTNSYGYDAPRVLTKACYLGILALKRGWHDLFYVVRQNVHDFEPKHVAKHLSNLPAGIDAMNHNVMGLPSHDQLLRELLDWRRDMLRGTGASMLSDSGDMMQTLVTVHDLDRFVFEVWRTLSPGSRTEVELKAARTSLLEGLLALIDQAARAPDPGTPSEIKPSPSGGA